MYIASITCTCSNSIAVHSYMYVAYFAPQPGGKKSSSSLNQSLRGGASAKRVPSSGQLRSGYYSDSMIMCLNRQASNDSSIQEIEEEKVQQLKQVSTRGTYDLLCHSRQGMLCMDLDSIAPMSWGRSNVKHTVYVFLMYVATCLEFLVAASGYSHTLIVVLIQN